jgi:hypothetical protein
LALSFFLVSFRNEGSKVIAMQRRRAVRWATGLVMVIVAAAPARAQFGPPGPGMGGGGMMMGGNPSNPISLLTAPAVQEELKLADPQKTSVLNLARSAGQKGRDIHQAMLLSGGSNPQVIMAAARQLRHETDQAIAGILDSKQRERFDQIVLQVEGPLAVARPEIASKLGLNGAQNQAVQQIMMQMQMNLRRMMMSIRQGAATGQFDPTQMGQVRAMAGKVRDEAVQQVSKIIDRKQKANFNKMLGDRFDVSKLDPSAMSDSLAIPPPSTTETKPADSKAEPKEPPKAEDEETPAQKETGRPSSRPSRKKSRAKP